MLMAKKTLRSSQQELTDVDLMAQVSAAYWAKLYSLRLASGLPFTFDGREYQIEPMQTVAKETVHKKATGGGFSEIEIIKSIHGMRYGRYPQGVGYFFPTDTDMQDYVKTRFNPLINNNYNSIGRYIKTGRKGTDSAGVKRIGNANLYLRGTTLAPQGDGDVRQSTKTSGIQIDRAVLDEVDQMESEVIAKIRGRMANACVDGIKGFSELVFIGNPSDDDRGVDLLYQSSDQREWFRNCSCGAKTCAEIEFLNDPEKTVGINSDGTGYIRCSKCGKPVGVRNGIWISQKPEITTRIGYHWSHLSSEYQDPARILRDYRNPPEGNFGDVMRLDLGLSYSSQDERLRKENVYNCCCLDPMPDSHGGPCAMGVDNDDKKHVVIGVRTGNDRYRLVKMAKVESFQEVHDLARKYNVKSCVADLRPNADSAREFQKNEKYKVFLCEYTESPLQDFVFNDETGIVKAYRTGIYDSTHRIILNNYIILPRRTPLIDEFALQCCNCVKSKEKNKKTQQVVFRYKKTGDQNDHYRNALNYFVMAASKCHKVSEGIRNSSGGQQFVISDKERYI
jgi:hypothetical protein